MKKAKLFLIFSLLTLTIILVTGSALAINTGGVTIITEPKAYGQTVTALVIEYPEMINPDQVSSSTYEVQANLITQSGHKEGVGSGSILPYEVKPGGNVGPRTITKVYTNNKPEFTSEPAPGNYVIIELYPLDPNALTLYYTGSDDAPFIVEYMVLQKTSIETNYGAILPAGMMISQNRKNLVGDDFKALWYEGDSGKTLPYRLYIPEGYNANQSYPLVVFLHGAGQRGSDNLTQLMRDRGAAVFAENKENPCFVLAPQCPVDGNWVGGFEAEKSSVPSIYLDMVYEVILQLVDTYSIDQDRIYGTGLSMGAMGTWAQTFAHPDLYAAIVPISGGGYPDKAELVAHMPIWIFQAEDDPTVNVGPARDMVEALKEAGNDKVLYTEYAAGVNQPPAARNPHYAWEAAYNTGALIDWLLSQSKSK
jgi:predicted peptidase